MPLKTDKAIPVYTAILVDMEKKSLISDKKSTNKDCIEWKNEDERMTLTGNDDDCSTALCSCPRGIQLFTGSLVGILASLLGLKMMHTHLLPTQSFGSSYISVVLIAFAWSTLTAGMAYMVFCATIQAYARCFQSLPLEEPLLDGEENSLLDEEVVNGSTYEHNEDPISEYYFVLGVFVGFCATATVHDASYGIPVTSLICTAGLAIVWGLFMVGCLFRRNKLEHQHQQRRGKAVIRLPMIVV